MGGEDIRRGVEWFQGQWRSDLKINLELQSREQKMFLAWLKAKPPALFRKGLSLNRPTCLAALETFSKDNAENFIGFKNERFEKILTRLSESHSEEEKKKLCSEGLAILIQEAWIIPLGEIKFTVLVDPKFRGWSLNELNQLDLRGLEVKQIKP